MNNLTAKPNMQGPSILTLLQHKEIHNKQTSTKNHENLQIHEHMPRQKDTPKEPKPSRKDPPKDRWPIIKQL